MLIRQERYINGWTFRSWSFQGHSEPPFAHLGYENLNEDLTLDWHENWWIKNQMGYTKMTCVFEACKVVWRILMSKVSMMRYSSRALLFIVLWSSCCLALEGPPPSDCCSFWCGCFSISQNFFSKWATGSTLLNWWRMFHHMRHAAASQSPVFACSPGNCTSYTSHFGRRTSNKKMMMSWYPKQPDITSFKWMFLDFQPFPFLSFFKDLE